MSCQPTENIQLRDHFHMQPDMTGVLVSKINPLSEAYKVLKKDDVILAFDGVPIANDGTGVLLLVILDFNAYIFCCIDILKEAPMRAGSVEIYG